MTTPSNAPKPETPRWISPKTAAAKYDYSDTTSFRELMVANGVPCAIINRKVHRFWEPDLDAFFQSRRN